jgi:uncharacterized protein YbjT (DUF2867 family)
MVIIGGTGKTGRRLTETLQRTGNRIKAASRSGAVKFDWRFEDTWSGAIEHATAVYLIAPVESAAAARFVDAATAGGVRKFVCLSARALERFPAGSFDEMKAAEAAVQSSGVEWSILRANNFNQNFDQDPWRDTLRAGRLALPMDGTPEPFVDVQDIADVAAEVLTSDGHHERTYDLSGPRGITFADAVSLMAAAAGREIRYEELSLEAYRDLLLSDGLTAEVADELMTLFEVMRAGAYAEPGRGVQEVLGREPRSFEDFAAKAAAIGAWA